VQVPSGLLPVLEIDGRVVTESAVIMNLLEEAFPDHQPLMPPAGSPQRSRADQLMRLERRWALQYSTVVGWEGPSVPRGSLGLIGMIFQYRTPVSQAGFVGTSQHVLYVCCPAAL